MKSNKRDQNDRRFEKNRLNKIERNKRKRVSAKRAMKIAMKEEDTQKS